MDSGDLGGTTHEALESASGKRAKVPSWKKRDDEQQKQDKRRKKEAAATASAKRAATRDQNRVHDPSPAEVQAFVSDPAQQATRNAANAARFQDLTPASRLNPVRPDKRALHTNQLALQVYESRQATGTNPTSLSVPPRAGQTQQAASVSNSINGNGATINRNASVQDIHVEPGASAHRSTVMPPPPANSHPSYTSITSTTHVHSRAQLAIRHPTNAPPPTPTRAAYTRSQIRRQSHDISRPLDRKAKKQALNLKRPSIRGTTDGRGDVISKAADYYGSYMMANDPLALGSFDHWANLAVRDACNELGIDIVATEPELKILANRQSNIRKPFLDAARKFVPSFYRIWEPMGESHSTSITVNKSTVKRLLSEALFSHQDHSLPIGNAPYMSPIFYGIIKECVFKSRNSYGVRYHAVWSRISLEHLAFLATLVQKVLSEWSTGVRIETPFVAEDQKTIYYEHLEKLQEQRRACAVALDMHCRSLVKNARDALGSGPDLTQGPKSGASSASIQLWAQQYASAAAGASGSASNTQSELSFGDYSQLDNSQSQYDDFDLGFESQTLDGTTTESSFAALTQDVVASQPESLNQTFEESPSLGDPPLGSDLRPQGTHPTPPSLEGYLSMLPPYAPPPIDVNPDTQTESEVDSYVTLRPSQSISQVNRESSPLRSLSPATPFDEEVQSWFDGWVEARSVSQDHAQEFSFRYPTPPAGDSVDN